MSKAVKPSCAYAAIAPAPATGSSTVPPRSMSATCQRPVTMRGITSPVASSVVSIIGACSTRQASLDALHFLGAHLAGGRHLAVRDAPQAERADDVAVAVELHCADHADVAH